MFKKTRVKIILSVMAAITLLLFGTLAIILGTSYAQMATDNQRMLEQYARDYRINEAEMADMPGDPGGASAEDTPPKPDSPPPEALHKFNVSTFYSVAVAEDQTVLKIDNASETLYPDETLEAYAYKIMDSDATKGRIESLCYLKVKKRGYTLVAFIDNTVIQGSMATLLRNTLLFGGVAVIAIFFASIFLARRIISPLEESWKKQKQFISDAGHELKTPVSVISANAELLSREVGNNQWLSNIRYENERMGSLVKQLLELAKTENVAPQIERLDFSRLVSGEMLPFESVAYEQGLELHTDIDGGLAVNGDADRLRQLVSILIDNAIRHSENGKAVEVLLHSEHGFARLSVINDGKEIPREQQKHIFERFYRVDSARSDDGHFGLGLSIAKAIVDAHKGKIGLSCRDGKVEFFVLLPLLKQLFP